MCRGGNVWAGLVARLLTEGQIVDCEFLVHNRARDRNGDAHSNDAASHRGFTTDEDILGRNRRDWHSAVSNNGWAASLDEFHFDLLSILLLQHREAHILVRQGVGWAELEDKRRCNWLSQEAFAGDRDLRPIGQLDVHRIAEAKLHGVNGTRAVASIQGADSDVWITCHWDALSRIEIDHTGFVGGESSSNRADYRTVGRRSIEQIWHIGVDAVFIIRWHSLNELGLEANAGGDEGDGCGDEFHDRDVVGCV